MCFKTRGIERRDFWKNMRFSWKNVQRLTESNTDFFSVFYLYEVDCWYTDPRGRFPPSIYLKIIPKNIYLSYVLALFTTPLSMNKFSIRIFNTS